MLASIKKGCRPLIAAHFFYASGVLSLHYRSADYAHTRTLAL
jgi:hypothetical protein